MIVAPQGQAQTDVCKYWTWVKVTDKRSSLIHHGINYGSKKSYNIGPYANVINFHNKLECPWQAFLAQSNVCG